MRTTSVSFAYYPIGLTCVSPSMFLCFDQQIFSRRYFDGSEWVLLQFVSAWYVKRELLSRWRKGKIKSGGRGWQLKCLQPKKMCSNNYLNWDEFESDQDAMLNEFWLVDCVGREIPPIMFLKLLLKECFYIFAKYF